MHCKSLWIKASAKCVMEMHNCDDFGFHLTKTHQFTTQQLEYFIRPNNNNIFSELLAFWKVDFTLYVLNTWEGLLCFNYCLNVPGHGGDQFVHSWGGMEAQVFLTVAFSSSAFFGLLFLIFLLTIPHRFSMVQVWWVAGQSSTPTHGHLTNFWCFWQCGQVPNPAGKLISIFKKLVSRRSMKCSKFPGKRVQWRWFSKNTMDQRQQIHTRHYTPNHHRLWKLNTGHQATWTMNFSTLPPDSRTLF